MKVRHSWYIFLMFAFSTITLFFNNCAPDNKNSADDAATASAESSVEVVTNFSGKLTANFQYVSTDGRAFGYALDTVNKTQAIKVIFYSGGPVGTGTLAGEIIAKESGVGTYAGHYYSFKVPAELANGKTQKIWAYGYEAKTENLIKPSPVSSVSYSSKAEPYFNSNMAPFIASNCVRCHTWTYQAMFYGPLMNTLPISGGTATNNKLIRKMSGLEGHTGGQFCTSTSSEICATIQAWWNAEFL